MKTLLLILLLPFALLALEPAKKKLNLKLPTKADDDARRLQKQSAEAESPVPKDQGMNLSCKDEGGTTYERGEPGWEKCLRAQPNPSMGGSVRQYEGPTKNTVNPTTRTTQSDEGLPSVQVRE